MSILGFINEYVTAPAIFAVMSACGVYFTASKRLLSPKKLKLIFRRQKSEKSGISPLSALSVALAGTLGVGNISGVAVAISIGGAGSVFWMIICAVLGCSLKYCEAYLSVKTRPQGDICGGAPYYIKAAFGRRAASVFAVICIVMSFFSGSFIQMNAAAVCLDMTYGIPHIVSGAAFAVICLAISLGGIKRVSAFTSAAMPVFCGIFTVMSVAAIIMRITEVPGVVERIISEAFGISQIAGGFSGALVASGIRAGFTKGVFSNEAGCGTSSFSHAASSSASPYFQGGMGILEVIADTVIFGGLTALVILLYPSAGSGDGYDGTAVSMNAYAYFFGRPAYHVLTFLIVFFAFATVLCWSYYGCCCVRFLSDGRHTEKLYLFLYCASLALGAVISVDTLWQTSDILCAVMLIFNCLCLLKLRKDIK